MVRNINNVDKGVRVVLAIILAFIGMLLQPQYGTIGLVVPIVIGLVLLTTAFLNFCPIYRVLGVSTCPTGKC